MTYRSDDVWDDEADEADEDAFELTWLGRILIVALLVATGSGSALLWRSTGGSLQSFVSAAPAATAAEKTVTQAELDAARQQIVSLNRSTQQLLAAQQAEIKRLSDQIATLSGKLDLLQRPVTSAQAAIPPVKPTVAPAEAKKKQETAKPTAAAKLEPKVVDTRPTGSISTGGAPLPLTR